IKEQLEAREAQRRNGLEVDPLVAAVLARFPGAEIIAARGRESETIPGADPEIVYEDGPAPDDQ
ncbi:MAG: DNA polymerase III subunit gamma/tau, partial [Methylocystis sp.]|nr:DNA polymerase III subunit gamma/tau [Methylocystis sp.]